jgi:hypothetical protein
MKHHITKAVPFLIALMIASGCAGVSRGCSNCWAKNAGADYVVVELAEMDGTPYRCWALKDVSIDNETNSDGIYWKDPQSGNLVHISGSYDYVQVVDGKWAQAYEYLNLTEAECAAIRSRTYNSKARRYE